MLPLERGLGWTWTCRLDYWIYAICIWINDLRIIKIFIVISKKKYLQYKLNSIHFDFKWLINDLRIIKIFIVISKKEYLQYKKHLFWLQMIDVWRTPMHFDKFLIGILQRHLLFSIEIPTVNVEKWLDKSTYN